MAATAENAPGNWGLIAGNGDFPFLVLEGARSRGIEMAVIAIREEASPALEHAARRFHWISLGELEPRHRSAAPGGSDARGDGRAGEAQQDFQFDPAGLASREAFIALPKKNTDSLIGAVARVLQDARHRAGGFHEFLGPLLPAEACSPGARPDEGEAAESLTGGRWRGRLRDSTWGKRW